MICIKGIGVNWAFYIIKFLKLFPHFVGNTDLVDQSKTTSTSMWHITIEG